MSEVTVSAGEKLPISHGVGEAEVVKVEHVLHSEKLLHNLLLPLLDLLYAVQLALGLLVSSHVGRENFRLAANTHDLTLILPGLVDQHSGAHYNSEELKILNILLIFTAII